MFMVKAGMWLVCGGSQQGGRHAMFALQDIVLYAVLAGILAAGALLVWRWGRRPKRYLVVGIATTIGFGLWYLTLNATDAGPLFDIDAPIFRVSCADAGAGIFAFVVSALVLGLGVEPQETARHVVGAAAIAGIVALVLDIFVL
jgi:hypothetical protein